MGSTRKGKKCLFYVVFSLVVATFQDDNGVSAFSPRGCGTYLPNPSKAHYNIFETSQKTSFSFWQQSCRRNRRCRAVQMNSQQNYGGYLGGGRSVGQEHRPSGEGRRMPGIGCMLIPTEQIILPGEERTVHIYDTNLLQVLVHAVEFDHSAFNMICYHTNSSTFQLDPAGCLVKALGVTRHQHVNILGEASSSLLVHVVGVKQVVTGKVEQYEPYLRVSLEEPGPSNVYMDGDESVSAEALALRELAAQCEALCAELGLPGGGGGLGARCAAAAAQAATGRRFGASQNRADSPRLAALAAAALLPRAERRRALATLGPRELVARVRAGLEDRHKMLLAMKSLKTLT